MDETHGAPPLDVSRETLAKFARLRTLLTRENERQNLVSRSSLDHYWSRHVADSAQLLRFAPKGAETWLDLGSGAGFPGLVLALLEAGRVTLVEARPLRCDFLRRAAAALGVEARVEIICAKVEKVPTRRFDAITARAFAPLDRLFGLAERFSRPGTIWILPKGRNAKSELEAARASWQGDFRLEPSLTDPEAQIIVATEVRRKIKRLRSA